MKSKLIVGIMLMTLAILISGLAGFVSIIGMVALFPAGGLTIVAIMALLESSKLLIAGWTHANWKNKLVPRWLKAYMVAAIITLMAITGMGVYGFMTKAHLEQNAPTAAVQINIDQKEAAIDQLEAQRGQLQTQQNQINETVSSYLEGGRAQGAGTFIRQQRAEQTRIQTEIKALNDQITAGEVELAPLRREMAGSEVKLGPLKAAAELIGLEDPAGAVKFIILMLMFCFDPLAVGTMIAATITIGEYLRLRRESETASHFVLPPAQPDIPMPETTTEREPEVAVEETKSEGMMLNWQEADEVIQAEAIRQDHKERMNEVKVFTPSITLPDVEIPPSIFDRSLDLQGFYADDDFSSGVVPAPKPVFGGLIEPTPKVSLEMVEEPIDDSNEKPDNRARLISILEEEPALMEDLIRAVVEARPVPEAPAEAPPLDIEDSPPANKVHWLDPNRPNPDDTA